MASLAVSLTYFRSPAATASRASSVFFNCGLFVLLAFALWFMSPGFAPFPLEPTLLIPGVYDAFSQALLGVKLMNLAGALAIAAVLVAVRAQLTGVSQLTGADQAMREQ